MKAGEPHQKEGENDAERRPAATSASFTTMLKVCMIMMALMVVVISSCCHKKPAEKATPATTPATNPTAPQEKKRLLLLQDEASEQALVEKLAIKLQPAELQLLHENDDEDEDAEDNTVETIHIKPKLKPHQFLHLHHMKTGGTSMDHMMRCAMDRLSGRKKKKPKRGKEETAAVENENNEGGPILYDVPYYNIHECSRMRFQECLDNQDSKCRPKMEEAAVMSYCAPLSHLDEFGWTEWGMSTEEMQVNDEEELEELEEELGIEEEGNTTDTTFVDETTTTTTTTLSNERIRAFTVLRHPVERVWSMFRFQTRICYKCMNLTEIYDKVDSNNTEVERADGSHHHFDDLCLDQLRNHEVTNMLTSGHFPKHPEDEETQDAMVAEAIANMKKYFTVIGITEQLVETRRILGEVFPWMNETLEGYEETCPLGHENASPSNNRCVKNGVGKTDSHWDLPKHPDEATRQAIEAHNQMDIKLYEAAVEYFELQKRALEWDEQES